MDIMDLKTINRFSIVIIGNLNPAILHPEWFDRNQILPPSEIRDIIEIRSQDLKELEGMKVRFIGSNTFVSAADTRLGLPSYTIKATPERFEASTTKKEKFEELAEFVTTTFKVLEHTPVSAIGINFDSVLKFSQSANDLVNPAMNFNSADKTLSLIELEVGETAKFSHAYASAYDIIIDGSSVAEFSWYGEDETSLKGSFVHNTNQGNRPEIIEGLNVGDYTSINGDLIGNSAVQVTCTSGTLKLYGILWHVYKNNLIPFNDLDLAGTWAEEAWDYSHPNSVYTDVIDDYLTFTYKRSGATIFLNRQSAAGIVDVYLNGEIYLADEDLYTTATFVKPIYITHAESDYYDDIGDTVNTVTVHLKGVNVSAISPVATNRRLGVVMVKEFDRR